MPAARFLRSARVRLPLLLALAGPHVSAQTLPEGPRLRDLADARGVLIGSALGDGFSSSEMGATTFAAYTTVAGREFNFFTAENAFKFGRIHPTATTYNFPTSDRYDSFARSVGALFHGHAFIWYKTTSTPPFVVDTTSREGLLEILNTHIDTVGARYGPGTSVWDVVNETLQSSVSTPPDDWRDALRDPATDHWRNIIGDDYIELSFIRAAEVRAARGQTHKLIYNDFSNENLTNKSLAQYKMAQDFLARGIPLEGIGFQMHVNGTPSYAGMRANFKRLSDLGLDLYITEFDTITGSSASELDRQAAIYQRSLDVALRNPHFRAFQTWGFTDRTSWLTTWTGNPLGADVRPLPFTADFAAKPAYYGLQDALAYEYRDPLLQNTGFETSISPWFASAAGDTAATLALSTALPHSGTSALAVRDRASPAAIVTQDVLARLASDQGGAGRYHLSGWFRIPSGPASARLTLRVTDSTGATRDFSVTGVAGASWTRLSGWINVGWSRAPVSASVIADTPGVAVDFDLDDVHLGDGNLITNPTMEGGVTGWTVLGTPALTSETTQAYRHYGDRGLRATARGAAWHGPAQNIRAALLAAGPGSYEISGYFKTDATVARTAKLTVRLTRGLTNEHFSVTRDINAASWTRVSGQVALSWDTPPDAALLYAETSAGTEALALDDVRLRKIAEPARTAFDTWLALHFTELELADAAIAGPTATPAGDGLANLVKYALGLAPRTPAAPTAGTGAGPRLERDGAGRLVLALRRLPDAAVNIAIETSTDLTTWSPVAVSPTITSDATATGYEWLAFTLPNAASEPAIFYRTRFTLP